jgi:general L-amino acid transport system permease protein
MSASSHIRPPQPPGPITWARENLFNNWYNTLLTFAGLAVIYFALAAAIRWAFFLADWSPVTENLLLYLVGQYPREHLWRIGLSLAMVSVLFGLSWGRWGGMMQAFSLTLILGYLVLAALPSTPTAFPSTMRLITLANPALILGFYGLGRRWQPRPAILTIGWLASMVIILILLRGLPNNPGVPLVEVNLWGGLIVTFILAIGGITLSFPIGVLLALGRRSSLPVVSLFSTAFIEVIRGVPLITILFMGSLIVPLFLPPEVRVDRILRALVGMIIFSAAYTAENVRGGLQAIPLGQVEAAKAIGLNNLQTTALIVLPQALRLVIPAIVGQFISLFKDTTLASGVAVLELLQIGRSILQANPKYLQSQFEVYLFIAAIFWVFSYSMSTTSRRIEVSLGVGER